MASSLFAALRPAVLVALVALPGLASAASLSSISWSVTGGTFSSGGASTGPITGGSLVYHPAGGTVSTPAEALVGGSLILTLTGPSGSFTVFRGGVVATISPAMARVRAFGDPASAFPVATAMSDGGVRYAYTMLWSVSAPAGAGLARGSTYFDPYAGGCSPCGTVNLFSHTFTVGSEVRAPVPEPSTGVLLGSALLAVIELGRRWWPSSQSASPQIVRFGVDRRLASPRQATRENPRKRGATALPRCEEADHPLPRSRPLASNSSKK
jgi:hypothetical protein